MCTILLVNDLTILHLSRCLILFITPFYRVNVCLHRVNNIVLFLVRKNITSLWPTSNNFFQVFIAVVVFIIYYKIYCILLWNTFKILPIHGCISINRYSNTICLYCRIWLVTILHKIINLPVVTKWFSWKDPPSWKREHVTFTTINKKD